MTTDDGGVGGLNAKELCAEKGDVAELHIAESKQTGDSEQNGSAGSLETCAGLWEITGSL